MHLQKLREAQCEQPNVQQVIELAQTVVSNAMPETLQLQENLLKISEDNRLMNECVSRIETQQEQHECSVKRLRSKTHEQLQKLEENHLQLRQEVDGGVQGLSLRLVALGKTSRNLEKDLRKVIIPKAHSFLLLEK